MIDFATWGTSIIQSYGLLGLFVVSVISNSSILVVLPGWMFIMLAASYFNPIVVAVVAALGSTLGESTSYLVGRGGHYIAAKKIKDKKKLRYLDKVEGWFKMHGFILLPIFGAGPLPMDLLGIVAGTLEYKWWKYFLGVFIGKLVKCLVLAYLGYTGYMILGP